MAQALMATAQSGKSQSAQGREWSTVVLSIPQPPTAAGGQAPRPPSQADGQWGQRQSLPQPQMQSIHGSAGLHQQQHAQAQGQRSPSMPPTSVLSQAQLAPGPQAPGGSSPSQIPPVAPHQGGPSTHVSGMRPPGVPTHVSGGTPEVPVMRPPPVGFPLWVVIVVGVAGLVVGFVLGAVVL
jgi:hypothetical protein